MATGEMLGVELPEREPIKMIDVLESGLPASSLASFKTAAGLADSDIADLLQIAGRTLTRVKGSRGRLPAALSDRLYAVASVYALALDVFGDRDAAIAWMDDPQFAFSSRRPRALLSSEIGRQQVRDLLFRIEHGQLA